MKLANLRLLNGLCLLTLSALASSFADFRPLSYDTPSYIEFELTSYSVAEDASTLSITLIRMGDFRRYSSVDYSTSDNTATGGEDFKAAGGTIVFAPGETRKVVELTLLQDQQAEDTEDFLLALSNEDPNSILVRPSVSVAIEDVAAVAALPRLEISPAPGAQIRLAWDATGSNCSLERSTDPAGTSWETVPAAVEVVDDKCFVLQSVAGPHYFYRLCAK